MKERINFIEVNYQFHQGFADPEQVISLHRPSNLFAAELKNEANITLVKHLNHSGECTREGIGYSFFKSKNKFTYIPFRSHRSIQHSKPDMVLVQGLIFPIQVMALRMKLGSRCLILLQHHGELPFKKKRIFQRLADGFINGYFFTSLGNATIWRKHRVIKDEKKCFELPSSSTSFVRKDKATCKQQTGLNGNFNFLWVGRLNGNKDPLTVVHAFARYTRINPAARLYMVYQHNELLPEIIAVKKEDAVLEQALILVGLLPNDELEIWYNAADYFISGSHHEGGSYALTEAMACGCIPIVTDIPAAMKTIDNGKAGYYYEAGNSDDLFSLLSSLQEEDQPAMSDLVHAQFERELSPGAIASKLLNVYQILLDKNKK